jgi:hypothetical protein
MSTKCTPSVSGGSGAVGAAGGGAGVAPQPTRKSAA